MAILNYERPIINRRADRNSQHVIYILWCSFCPQAFYVDQTTLLRNRILNHLSNIRLGQPPALALNFNQKDHPPTSQTLRINILETLTLPPRNTSSLQLINRTLTELERKWIRRLTANGRGLNWDPQMDYMITFTGQHSKATQILYNKFKDLTDSIQGPPKPTQPFHKITQAVQKSYMPPRSTIKFLTFL